MNNKHKAGIWRTYRCELYRLFHKRSFWLAFILLFLYAASQYMYYALFVIQGKIVEPFEACAYFIGFYQMYSKYQPIYFKVFPLLLALPCISAWYEDTIRNKTASLIMQKTSPLRYLLAKAMAYFTGNMVMVFLCYAGNLLACALTFGQNYSTVYGERYSEFYYLGLMSNKPMPFMGYYATHTFAYLLIFSLVLAVFSGICGVFAYACTLWLNRTFALVFVLLYGMFYFTTRYAKFIKGFDINYVLCVGNQWGPGFGKIFILLNAALLASSLLLILLRRAKGVKMIF